MNYSLDTNTVTDFLHNERNVISNMERAMLNDDTIFIDDIVYYEISRWLRFADHPKQFQKFETLYEFSPHLKLDRKAMEQAIEIYNQLRNGQLIEDNDIFIAAMAMVNDCVLVTANEKHFERIDGLRYINWRL